MSTSFFERHETTLEQAVAACRDRRYWSAYEERPTPKVYGETAAADGERAFKARLGKSFEIDQPGTNGRIGAERSPYGIELAVDYPRADLDALIDGVLQARQSWARAEPRTRVGVCLEILARINARSFEIAQAVMHTSGQAFMMAFQAGGPHAQDRALEAVAYAWEEMRRTPRDAQWEKPQGKHPPLVMHKRFHVVPRGIGLVIGCSTFPTWNSYPAIFADLATGNAVIVKPHPGAILPLAITVEIARTVLDEAGFDPNVITLAADAPDAPIAQALATRSEIDLIDYTGGTEFGDWLEANARQAQVYTEKAGVNCVVIDATDGYKGMLNNLAFTLSLYSGQMCTTPQNIFVPSGGIETDEGHKSFDEVARGIGTAIDKLLSDTDRAVAILGAIQNEATRARVEAAGDGDVLLASRAIEHPEFPQARIRTPLLRKARAADRDSYGSELFGPISFIVEAADTAQSFACVAELARQRGAITFGVYATDAAVLERAEDVAINGGVALSCNLTGGIYVNQTAAYSDFHATGANPAANACYSDAAFVANRFRVVQSRRHAA